MSTSNHSKQILIGNLETQSHVLCTSCFCSQVFKLTSNVLNSDVKILNIALIALEKGFSVSLIALCPLHYPDFARWSHLAHRPSLARWPRTLLASFGSLADWLSLLAR